MQTLSVPCTETSPSIAIKTLKVCKFSVGIRAETNVQKSGGGGDHSCPLSATFSHSCCGNTGLLLASAPQNQYRASQFCGSVSILVSRPLRPRRALPWLPGLAGGSGVGRVCPGLQCLTALSWRVPLTVWLGSSLGTHVTPAPGARTISLLA